MKKQRPPPYYFTDHDGRHLVQLQVHGSDTPTVTEAVVWDNAKRRYGLDFRFDGLDLSAFRVPPKAGDQIDLFSS